MNIELLLFEIRLTIKRRNKIGIIKKLQQTGRKQ